MRENTEIRQPIVEGLFYPAESKELDLKVKNLIECNPSQQIDSNTIIVPHGGYDYAGSYIATAFNSLPKKDFKRVIIISNVHREFTNAVYIPESTKFLVSQKNIPVDKDAIKQIIKTGKKVIKSNIPHMEEHGIETVLPFISYLYPNCKIVPILLGKTIVSLVRNLSNIVESIFDKDTLVVISSNFSQYEKENISEEIGKLGIELTKNGKLSDLIELTRINKLKTCGAGAISSLLLQSRHKNVVVLKEGLTEQTPLSGGKATYYGALTFENKE